MSHRGKSEQFLSALKEPLGFEVNDLDESATQIAPASQSSQRGRPGVKVLGEQMLLDLCEFRPPGVAGGELRESALYANKRPPWVADFIEPVGVDQARTIAVRLLAHPGQKGRFFVRLGHIGKA